MIKLIVAMDENGLIGQNGSSNGMPWHNKEDLLHFKNTTLNKTIVMGSTTFLAMNKALKNRKTIVVSSKMAPRDDVEVRRSLHEVIEEYKQKGEDLYVSGGAFVYKQALPYVEEMLISRIPGHYEGETYFPDFSQYGFKCVECQQKETFTLEIYRKDCI